MTLDFAQLSEQVRQMGQAVSARQRTLEQRLEIALEWLRENSERHEAVWERVALAGSRNTKYRGASPIGDPGARSTQGQTEPMAQAYPLLTCPDSATLIAVDGSQIYPDAHAAMLYYLVNIGVIVAHHGAEAAPTCRLYPELFYDEARLRVNGRMIRNVVVNARRTIAERVYLAEAAKQYAGDARPLVAVADGPLLFWVGSDVPDAGQGEDEKTILNDYMDALLRARDDARATLVGYVDRPASTYVIRLLHLMSLDEDAVNKDALTTSGALEGLYDRILFGRLLKPGARSALFVQRSPTNKRYAQRDPDLEIAFFYMNAAMPDDRKPYLARVEMPMWVARARDLVDQLHALLYHQCLLVGRYPYMLARADELAVVQGFEKKQLENMIQVELRKHGLHTEASRKASTKEAAR